MWANVSFSLLCVFVLCLECKDQSNKIQLYVNEVWTAFLKLAEQKPNQFYKKDVDRIRGNKWFAERYVLVNRDVKKSFKHLVEAMKWRKTFGIYNFTDQYFPEHIRKKGFAWILPKKDKMGKSVVWAKFGLYNKSDEDSDWYQNYFIYQIEKVDRNTTNQGWALIIDSSGCGLQTIDMPMIKNLLSLFRYYAKGFKYIACINLPTILRGTVNLVKALMYEDLRKSFQFIDREGLSTLLNKDDIPNYIDDPPEQTDDSE